jgi:hypothetical protein
MEAKKNAIESNREDNRLRLCKGDLCVVVNPIGLRQNHAILLSYEGSSQPYLDGVGRVVPVTCFVGSRDPGPPASD